MDVAIVEMGVEEKMAPEDQHGGYSHPTSHSTSSDLTTSLHISWTDSVAILTCVAAREQVLLSTSLSTTLHFPPRSGCLAVLVDRLFSDHRWLMTQAIGWKDPPWVYLEGTTKLWLSVRGCVDAGGLTWSKMSIFRRWGKWAPRRPRW